MKKYLSLLGLLTFTTGLALNIDVAYTTNSSLVNNDNRGKGLGKTVYIRPGIDLYSTINAYYSYILTNFNTAAVKGWNKIDFEKTAMIIYNSIGQISDYKNINHPITGIKLLIHRKSKKGTDLILKAISGQNINII